MNPIKIPMAPVASSQIAEIGHDPATSTMAIRFKSNASPLYHYAGVTAEEFAAFQQAESIGSYFYKHIKPFADRYPYTRINESAAPEPA